jgi:hypothetical protein
MFNPTLGAVLLMSPTQDALGWALLGLGLAAGTRLKVHPAFQYPCLGAVLWTIFRDFGIPMDIVLLACVPVCLVQWKANTATFIALVAAVVVNYFFAKDVHPPRDAWTPAVLALLYVGSSSKKLYAVGLVLARHLVPRGVHVLYGIPFYYLKSVDLVYYDRVVGNSVLASLFALVASEPWFHYALVAAGLLCSLSIKG